MPGSASAEHRDFGRGKEQPRRGVGDGLPSRISDGVRKHRRAARFAPESSPQVGTEAASKA